MSKKEFRFGGGLNLTLSKDAIQDNELLMATGVVFPDPGSLTAEAAPYSIQTALLTAVATGDRFDSVQGIADAFVLNSGSGAHYIFLKNQHCWQRVDYAGTNPTNIPVTNLTATDLAVGANAIVYTGAVAYYRVPSNGTLVVKMWGAGGGGGTGAGLGASNGGGAGAYATSTIAVSAGDVITVYVGRGGEGGNADDSLASGGYPDGGDAAIYSGTGATTGYQAGGGGGSTRIYLNGVLALVAGGGGGARLEGGSGGGTTGRDDANGGGTGGTQSAGGYDASESGDTTKWGGNFVGGPGGTNGTADAGGGGGGGYYGGGGGGGANFGSVRGGGGGSGYLGGLGSSESFTVNNTGTQSPAPGSGEAEYSASAGRNTGNPDSDTGTGGYRDATSSANNGNRGGNGYIVATFTAGGGGGTTGGPGSVGEHQLSAIRYNGFVYICDGYAFRKYFYDSSSATWKALRVGFAVPTAPTYSSETGSGGSVAGVTYKWAVTFARIDSSNNILCESNMSPFLEHTASASSKQIAIVLPVDSSIACQTNARCVYRSNENGDAMFFVSVVTDNTTTAYTDPIAVSSLKGDPNAALADEASLTKMPGVQAGLITGRSYPGSNPFSRPTGAPHSQDAELRGEIWYSNLGAMAEWRDHDSPVSPSGSVDGEGQIRNLRLLDDTAYGIYNNNTLAMSLLGGLDYWSPFRRVVTGRNTGEVLKDIQPWDKDIICYSDRAVYRFRRFGVDATESTIEKVADIGTPGENAVVVTENFGHIFMGWDGVYQFDGQRVRKLSAAIDSLWRDSSLANYVYPTTRTYAVGGGKGDKVWFAYRAYSAPSGADLFQNYLLHCDLTDGAPKWSTSAVDATSIHRGYDHTLFMGDQNDDLKILDYPTVTNVNSLAVRTKLQATGANIKNRAYPEKLFLDLDLAGQSVAVKVYANDYNTLLCTWTITGSNERRVYTKTLPFNMAQRLGVQFQITSVANLTYQPRFYGWGWFDNGAEPEA